MSPHPGKRVVHPSFLYPDQRDITGSKVVKWVKILKTEKTISKYSQSDQLRYVGKYKVRKTAKGLPKHHCYHPMLLMRTTKAIFRHLYMF